MRILRSSLTLRILEKRQALDRYQFQEINGKLQAMAKKTDYVNDNDRLRAMDIGP